MSRYQEISPAPRSNIWVAAGAAVCSAVAVLGLAAAAQPSQATFLMSPSTVRAVNVGTSQARMPVPLTGRPALTRSAAVTQLQAEAQDNLEVPVFQTPVSHESPTVKPLLGLTALFGATFGVLSLFFNKKESSIEDTEAARAPWVAGVAAASMMAAQTMAPADLMAPAYAGLPSSDPISNPEELLRNALPIPKSKGEREIRQVQSELQSITRQLRIPGSKPLGPIAKSVNAANGIVTDKKKAQLITDAFAPEKKDQGVKKLNELAEQLAYFKRTLDLNDKQDVPIIQADTLRVVGEVEECMVSGFPFEIPTKYAPLPRLLGRATVEMKVTYVNNPEVKDAVFTMVLDGYNAPLTAGNFFDLVSKGFYDGIEIQRSDGFVVQTGDPDGPATGYEEDGKSRQIPFEVKVNADKVPYYEETLEDLGVYNAPVALPFNAFGTMALAKKEFVPNSGSSQIFWLLKDSELTPVGNNVLDGRYAAFGYITKNQDLLGIMKVGDKINYMKVISGAENFKAGDSNAPPLTFD